MEHVISGDARKLIAYSEGHAPQANKREKAVQGDYPSNGFVLYW